MVRRPFTISIVIPAYNEEKYIGTCLKSIIDRKPKNVKEIIVVDNMSTDGTVKAAKKFPGVRVVQEKKRGTNAARHRGFDEAKGDLLAYLDADTKVPKGWFETINREFKRDPDLVCLSGPYEFYDLPDWQQKWVSFVWQALAVPSYSMMGYMVVGGNFVAKRRALQKASGFDTDITFYGDDTNIARRLFQIGTVKYSPKFRVLASARRLQSEGFLKTGATYAANYLSEAILKKPATKKHKDVR
jgi:glycosyltransferase involved in cell wall biosynthesis